MHAHNNAYLILLVALMQQVTLNKSGSFSWMIMTDDKVLARAQRKEVGNVKSMTTSKELRHGKEDGSPLFAPLAKTLAEIEHLVWYILVYSQSSDTYISIGAAVSLNNLIEVLTYYKDKSSTFSHLADHLKKVYIYKFIVINF